MGFGSLSVHIRRQRRRKAFHNHLTKEQAVTLIGGINETRTLRRNNRRGNIEDSKTTNSNSAAKPAWQVSNRPQL
jgi:hypothetical protein